MTSLSTADAILIVLVYIELVRSLAWLIDRAGKRLDARDDRRRRLKAAHRDNGDAERAHLVDIGNSAKFGLLRNAGVLYDDYLDDGVA